MSTCQCTCRVCVCVNNGKEEVAAATESNSDAVEPGLVVTESDITSSAQLLKKQKVLVFYLTFLYFTYENTNCMSSHKITNGSKHIFFAIRCM